MRERIASWTSQILNPFFISLVLLVLISFNSVSSPLEAVKWSLISIAVSIFPVFVAVIYLVRRRKLGGFSINIRQQRTKIYILASICAGIGLIIIHWLKAPAALMAIFATGLVSVVMATLVNLWWKISLHTAFVSASVAVSIILYGPLAAVALVLVPLIVWAKIELGHHSPAQAVAGAVLAPIVVVIVFKYIFCLV